MIRKLFTAAVSALVAGALTSCFSLPFKRQPDARPTQKLPQANAPVKPQEKPKPVAPVAEANAYYETAAASTSFFVARPESSRTDSLPDKILRRGTVVQVLVPAAGAGWSKVKLVDAQVGYVPLSDLDIVSSSVRPSGFPTQGGGGIDTGIELPEPPTTSPATSEDGGASGIDTINFDSLDLESPSPPPVPVPPSSSGLEDISLDNLPGL